MAEIATGAVARRLLAEMPELTQARIGELALANARRNAAFADRGRSIAELRGWRAGASSRGLVVAAGPSIARRNPAAALVELGFEGTIVATESSLYYLLRHGIVPHLVVTLDPHASRIVRWFGDPALDEARLAGDDYFRRQDQDASFAKELEVNRELLRLIDRHGPQLRIALATSASQAVVDRVLAAGMRVYWWNPMFDDPAAPGGVTRALQALNGFPAINAGGNVGSASWMICDAVLGLAETALVGVDFSYYADTPYSKTQYYHEAVALVGEAALDSVFVRFHNPHADAWFYTDPAYLWYRESFLEMARDAAGQVVNCTEGGILFGPNVDCMPLRKFLARGRAAAS
jgi:hypothetical protein